MQYLDVGYWFVLNLKRNRIDCQSPIHILHHNSTFPAHHHIKISTAVHVDFTTRGDVFRGFQMSLQAQAHHQAHHHHQPSDHQAR